MCVHAFVYMLAGLLVCLLARLVVLFFVFFCLLACLVACWLVSLLTCFFFVLCVCVCRGRVGVCVCELVCLIACWFVSFLFYLLIRGTERTPGKEQANQHAAQHRHTRGACRPGEGHDDDGRANDAVQEGIVPFVTDES